MRALTGLYFASLIFALCYSFWIAAVLTGLIVIDGKILPLPLAVLVDQGCKFAARALRRKAIANG